MQEYQYPQYNGPTLTPRLMKTIEIPEGTRYASVYRADDCSANDVILATSMKSLVVSLRGKPYTEEEKNLLGDSMKYFHSDTRPKIFEVTHEDPKEGTTFYGVYALG